MFAVDASAGYIYKTWYTSIYQNNTGEYIGSVVVETLHPEWVPQCFDLYISYYTVAGGNLDLKKIGDFEWPGHPLDTVKDAQQNTYDAFWENATGTTAPKFPTVVRTYESGATQTFAVRLAGRVLALRHQRLRNMLLLDGFMETKLIRVLLFFFGFTVFRPCSRLRKA